MEKNLYAGSGPGILDAAGAVVNDENEEDENPWDDDESGRTLATDTPSFEIPSNVPSPITVPPPAVPLPPKNPAIQPQPPPPAKKATLVGLMPADFLKSLPRAPSSPALPAVVPPTLPRIPKPAPYDELEELPNDQEDGPTMAVPAPYRPSDHPPRVDKDAETMSIDRLALGLRPRGPANPPAKPGPASADEEEDATRALPRDAFERYQDAHVVVGPDAIGDEATMALAPDFDRLPGGLPSPSSLGPALRPQGPGQTQRPPGSQPRLPGVQPNPMQTTQQLQPQPYPSSPQLAVAPPVATAPWPTQGQAANPAAWGPAPTGQGYANPQPAAWTGAPPQQQLPPATAPTPAEPGFQITPQILMLAGIGIVCLAIFVIGVVLFVTTKF